MQEQPINLLIFYCKKGRQSMTNEELAIQIQQGAKQYAAVTALITCKF